MRVSELRVLALCAKRRSTALAQRVIRWRDELTSAVKSFGSTVAAVYRICENSVGPPRWLLAKLALRTAVGTGCSTM